MNSFDQTSVPDSFTRLHQDARGRLTLPRAEFLARYELCEDMAQMLTERSATWLHGQGLAEDVVLARTQAGLQAPGSGFSEAEAGWVTTRLAELLGWPWVGLADVG